MINVVRTLAPNDQPPALELIAANRTVSGNGMLAVTLWFPVHHQTKIVAASWTFSSEVLGHRGRTHIATTTGESTCGIGLKRLTVQSQQ